MAPRVVWRRARGIWRRSAEEYGRLGSVGIEATEGSRRGRGQEQLNGGQFPTRAESVRAARGRGEAEGGRTEP